MRTIKITGKGCLKIRPDLTRITMTLEGLDPEYARALEASARDTGEIKTLLAEFGFAQSDVKTLHFSVDTEYESVQELNVYRQRFVGYRYRHTMKLEFFSDNDRLGKILYALANCAAKPELHISYTVSDPEAAKDELLTSAVKDAGHKARVLTEAAGLTLGKIESMDYSWGELDLEVRPMYRMEAAGSILAAKASFDMDLEPDDIQVTDTVTVIWQIEE